MRSRASSSATWRCWIARSSASMLLHRRLRGPSEAHRSFERELSRTDAVLECHHVTGSHTLLLKVRTETTESLEELIDRIRSLEGVT